MGDVADIRRVSFRNRRLERLGVEVMSFDELRARSASVTREPRRVGFHQLMLVEGGRGTHAVDFVEYALCPGTVLSVTPGQVQRWRAFDTLRGRLLLIAELALAPTLGHAASDPVRRALEDRPARSRPPRASWRELLADVDRLRADIDRFDGGPTDTAVVRHSLVALLLRFARGRDAAGEAAPRDAELVRLFRRELEAGLCERLGVQDYARRLGYSQSSLSRACTAVLGRSAKRVIDERVVLEAKRLLVHSPATGAEIGHRLGFTETTNFVKFFARVAGCTPRAFRAAHAPALGASSLSDITGGLP